MKTELTKTAIELGFKPEFFPLDQDFFSLLMVAVNRPEETCAKFVKQLVKDNNDHVLKILDKRIEVMELPITFSNSAKLAALALTEAIPGRMMTLLIDCLTQHEGEEMDAMKLCEMYPEGFYKEASVIHYVETYVKTRQVKWSEIY